MYVKEHILPWRNDAMAEDLVVRSGSENMLLAMEGTVGLHPHKMIISHKQQTKKIDLHLFKVIMDKTVDALRGKIFKHLSKFLW